MQPRAAEHLALGAVEDAHDERLAGVEERAERPQELDLPFERLRLVVGPVHPRLQVVEARVERVLQKRRVAPAPSSG